MLGVSTQRDPAEWTPVLETQCAARYWNGLDRRPGSTPPASLAEHHLDMVLASIVG